jgi:hypothetical protein
MVPVDRRRRAGCHGASARTLFALRPGKWSIASLFEGDAESVVLSPYDATIPDHLIGVHSELELGGDTQRVWNIKGGTGFRQVSDRTAVRAGFEFNRRALEHSTSISLAIFCHDGRPVLGQFKAGLLSGGYQTRLTRGYLVGNLRMASR